MSASLEALERIVRAALAPGAPRAAVPEAAGALISMAERAYAEGGSGAEGARVAFARYHALLHALHDAHEPRTYAARRFLTAAVYPIEEAQAPEVEPSRPLRGPEFVEHIVAEHDRRSGMRHPMSAHLFGGGAPTLDDVRIYLRHQWHRSRSFFRELTEFALTLTLRDAALIYRNLHEEAGGAPGTTAHPILFQRLLAHLGLPADLHEPPSLPEAHAYLTNRYRCVRHEDPAWGLAVLFSLEHGATETHGAIAALLARMGLPEHVTEFHRTHVEADAAHTADLLELVARLVVTADAQRTFLRSLYHHRALHRRYFDRIWSEMGGALDHQEGGHR